MIQAGETMHSFKRVLYLGWLANGNVGDDMLFQMFKERVLRRLAERSSPIMVDFDGWQALNGYLQDVDFYDLVVLGGGSIFNLPDWLRLCAQAQQAGIPTMSWGTGMDAMSISTVTIPPAVAELLREIVPKMKLVSCRGPITRHALQEIAKPSNDILVIGDPALDFKSRIKGDLAMVPRSIFVNWGTSSNNVLGGDESRVEATLATALNRLIEQGYSVTIAPMWTGDLEACERLASQLEKDRAKLVPVVLSADHLYSLIRTCQLSICFKLHAGILSAAAHRPPISLAYRLKCVEFATIIDSLDYCMPMDKVTADHITRCVAQLERNYSDVVARIVNAQQKYSAALDQSIDRICDLLDV